jgi:hypothetical protein
MRNSGITSPLRNLKLCTIQSPCLGAGKSAAAAAKAMDANASAVDALKSLMACLPGIAALARFFLSVRRKGEIVEVGKRILRRVGFGMPSYIARWQRQRRDVYVYFDNDQKSAAPFDAKRLMAMVDER